MLADAGRTPAIDARRVLPAGRGRIAILGALGCLAALFAPFLAGGSDGESGSPLAGLGGPQVSSSDAAGSVVALGPAIGLDPVDLLGKAVLVGALLYVTLRILRRVQSGPTSRDSRLVVLESRALAPKATLYLVAVGERRLVIGLAPGGITALAELEADELPPTGLPLLMTEPERAVR